MPCADGTSLMLAGLDALSDNEVSRLDPVHDSRLSQLIGCNRLLLPPSKDAENPVYLPAVRFPRWYYCPKCGRMRKIGKFSGPAPKCDNESCKDGRGNYPRLVPERFIVICPSGHIDDFPVVEWVHRGQADDSGRHVISRRTKGGSASLSDIEYSCSCGEHRSLFGATQPGALEGVYECAGSMPWLDMETHGCPTPQGDLRVVQRGGNNVWFADVVSSIFIPNGADPKVIEAAENNMDDLKDAAEDGEKWLVKEAARIAKHTPGVTADALVQAFHLLDENDGSDDISEGDYRFAEFAALLNPKEYETEGYFAAHPAPLDEYSSEGIRHIFSSITLVDTLRETRALVGMTRLSPDANEEVPYRKRREMLSRAHVDWTFATQLTGEGIFLRLDSSVLDLWLDNQGVRERIEILQKNLDVAMASRHMATKTINPYFVLIHSLSHAIMRSLSDVCGYSTASVRERIYCDKYIDPEQGKNHPDMQGLLIYTASSDSEGSLGGLVRAGNPGRFEDVFDRAINDARWCSSDPICIESNGQGPDSCNLAACHCCLLVPETSCEAGNKLLDRGLLVGSLENPSIGLFNQ